MVEYKDTPAEFLRTLRREGECVEFSADERFVLTRYQNAWYTLDQGLEIGSVWVHRPAYALGRDLRHFQPTLTPDERVRVVEGVIGQVKQAFFEDSLQRVSFHRFLETRSDYLCFEIVVKPVSTEERAGDMTLRGQMQGRPAFLRFEWRNGQTRQYNIGVPFTPLKVLQEVYYAQLGLTRHHRGDEDRDGFVPAESVSSSSVTLRFLDRQTAQEHHIPSHFFPGISNDTATFELVASTHPLDRINRMDLWHVASLVQDWYLTDYDPETRIGSIGVVDGSSPAPGREVQLQLIR